jgi:hypothetical protein
MPRPRSIPGENSLARIWHSYLILRISALVALASQTSCSRVLAGHPRILLLAAGRFCVCAGCTGGVRHRSPHVAGSGARAGPDLRFLVAGPGFEPGRLSSAILQTPDGNALTCANAGVQCHFGTH